MIGRHLNIWRQVGASTVRYDQEFNRLTGHELTMSQYLTSKVPILPDNVEQKRRIPYRNLVVGALMNVFQGVFLLDVFEQVYVLI